MKIKKKYCEGCPYDYGHPATEMAYNLGCLPSIAEINAKVGDGQALACHSEPGSMCCGWVSENKEKLPTVVSLYTEQGTHY